MDYNARFYDSYITHFSQPDTIIPDQFNPQSLNRYSYTLNNPIRYNDPSGHRECDDEFGCGPILSKPKKIGGKPPIITRSGWGARDPGAEVQMLPNPKFDEGRYSSDNSTGYMPYAEAYPDKSLAGVLTDVVIHYEGDTSVLDNDYNGADAVFKLQEEAMENGLYDIQYHYIIGPDGSIYEGRDIDIRGSHVSGEVGNTGKVGILWLGVSTSRGDIPTPQQMASTINLVEYLDAEYGIDELGGHREYEQNVGSYTECPGDHALIYANALKPYVR